MNERIKELAEQAGNHYRTTVPGADTFTNPVYGVIPKKFLDKFAELIVRDCIGIVEGYCETSPEIYGLPLEIMDHFGIDEIE